MIAKAGKRVWITTYPSGSRFYPTAPAPEDVHIEDIAHSLPMLARFLGHTSRFYSVGEHSCHVADWLWQTTENPDVAACGLLHDAEEAYVADLPRPIKHYGPLKAYRRLCDRAEVAIFEKFELTEAYAKYRPLIKDADDRMLHTESRRLNHKAGWEEEAKIICDTDVHIDQYSEQRVIDVLAAALYTDSTGETQGNPMSILYAINLLKLGGSQRRWHDEFMDRFERWLG